MPAIFAAQPVPGAQNAQIRTDYADIGLEFHSRAYKADIARRFYAVRHKRVTVAAVTGRSVMPRLRKSR